VVDLKKQREAANLTQQKLAELSGVSQQAICMIERGKRNPSAKVAMKLAKPLRLKWTKFFDDK
jgi:transcriptional regulator with XRE-family HTH domain